ncbi:hypothetical protein NDA18_001881 [Ustilago nuda]|nr:hypothetical protein NDA18_001881 [Ustilago nuda]
MSDLQRTFLRSKLNKFPPVPAFSEGEEEQAELSSGEAFAQPSSTASSSAGPSRHRQRNAEDFSPRTAEGYFEEALEVDLPSQSGGSIAFRVYYTPPNPKASAPLGPPAAEPSMKDVDINLDSPSLPTLRPGVGLPVTDDQDEGGAQPTAPAANPGTLFVFHHGAGFSALSYALTAAEIAKMTVGEVGVLAYDCRGHGRTRTSNMPTDPLDMSIDTLSSDLTSLLSTMFPKTEEMPSLVLVGHSMGGSVVVSAAHALSSRGFNQIAGVAVLDVVEGTAMDALSVMRSVVLSHPSGFSSVEDAIRWHVDSKTIANVSSARISVPPLLQPNPAYRPSSATAKEEEEPQEILSSSSASPTESQEGKEHALKWKANLLATEPFWRGWFEGLSSRFLSVRTARLLLLAGTDRLDKELMIGQMQGKYQLEVIADVGHSLHEDAPERTAKVLVDFWRRNERLNLPVRIKKVGES